MSNGHLLQLANLPALHPAVGAALLQVNAAAAVVRLADDPTALPSGTMSREVVVDWLPKPGRDPTAVVLREVGWAGVPGVDAARVTYPLTFNEHTLTEMAAVAVMALLIHDRHGGVVRRVLPIGSGGDYLVLTRRARKEDQVEVSGVREDADGQAARARLREKSGQVLTHCKCGFASVTAFSHPPGAVVQSYLHFVRKRRKKRRK